MKAVFDSDILIDYLQGLPQARLEMELFTQKCVSIVSWMEVLAGAENADQEKKCRGFLDRFKTIDVNQEIAEQTLLIRRKNKLKLPDAIIWATAQHQGCLLITRNKRDFPKHDPGIRIPYEV